MLYYIQVNLSNEDIMNFTEAIKHLNEAEQSLRRQIGESDEENYDSMFRCLEIAQKIRDIASELAAPQVQKKNVQAAVSDKVSNAPDDSEFPAYFVYEDKLWKVALRSDDSGELYKKSLPFSDAKIVCSAVHKLLDSGDVFTMSEAEKELDGMPTYKIQITVMALVKTGCFATAGRGKYGIAPGASRAERRWVDLLKTQQVRPELLK